MLVASLQEVGAARSIVIDENNRVLAGNGTVAAAAEAGIENVQVVDADGETIIAVRRSGLSKDQKTRLALLDNRTADIAEWDVEMLASIAKDGVDINDLWSENELNLMIGDIQPPNDPRAEWPDAPPTDFEPRACRVLNVYFPKPEDVEAFATLTGTKVTEKTRFVWYPKPPE
jgi:hypothetical protein